MHWLYQHIPSLLTLFGGLLAALGAFWAEARVMRRESAPLEESKYPFAPAIAIFLGALIGVAGVYWSDLRQSALEEQLVHKSQEIAQKSEEVARLSGTIAAMVSGGDSYCAVLPFLAPPFRHVTLGIVNRGHFPVYDVSVSITDVTKGKALQKKLMHSLPPSFPMTDVESTIARSEALESKFKYHKHYGELAVDMSSKIITLELSPTSEERYEITIDARNGLTTEDLVLRRVKGQWFFADKVWPGWNYLKNRESWPKPREIFVQPGFPRDNQGNPEW